MTETDEPIHPAFLADYEPKTPIPAAPNTDVVDERIAGDLRPNYYKVKLKARCCETGEVRTVEVECFQMIRALGLGFFDGNVLKYLWRAGRKTKSRLEDAKKVLTYARQALNDAEEEG